MMAKDASSLAIWLFDANCILCSRAVQYTLVHEREEAIRFVAIQSDEGRDLARTHQLEPDDPESFVFISGGTPYFKSDGVIELASYLRGPAQFAFVGKILPRFIRDWLYDAVARNRYRWFGRSSNCLVPSKKQMERFTLASDFSTHA